MNRRQFLGGSAAVAGALLGGETLSFLGRNVGVGGVVSAGRVDGVAPRADAVRGRVDAVDGTELSVELVAHEPGPVRPVVVRRAYPDGDVLAEGRADPVRLANPGTSATVSVDLPSDDPDDGRWFYEVYVDGHGERRYLCESAPFRWRRRPEYGARRAARVADPHDDASGDRFARERRGNDYVLGYRWLDGAGDVWRVRYRIRRSAHEAAVASERGYVRTYEESLSGPVVRDFAAALAADARTEGDGRGVSDLSAGERFDLLVRFAQGLRYARDPETLDDYDYNRTVVETLVAGVGDCKDKTHLLAGLLAAPPLDCDTAMLFQPAHVLLGVAAEDVPEPFDDRETVDLGGRDYFPVDPSLRFDVGAYPDAAFTAAYGDGEWFHFDAGAAVRGLDRSVHDWFERYASAE